MTVLFIVLLHAVPVFVIGAWTESKAALTIAAIIAAVIGAATGSAAYTFADMLGIFVAYIFGIKYINNLKPTYRMEGDKQESREEKKRAIRGKRFL